ncbi:MAG TPA: MlaD family protein [Tepidisphaeraceae bacterium]|nr:MlaD family protein [Tepidisphaeraceae bacterium]
MAKERNAFKAGIFMVASLITIVVIIVSIKGVGQFVQPNQVGTIRFTLQDDIGGLAAGDDVRIGGAKVGVVRSVDFDAADAAKPTIAVRYVMPKRFVLHPDAFVQIQSTVTGVSVLNFTSLGTGDVLKEGQDLVGQPAALTALLNSAPEITAVIHDVRANTLPKVNSTIDTYRGTGESATDFVKALRSKLDPIMERYNVVMDTAKAALQNISDVFGDTKADLRTTVANLKDATGTVKDKLPGLMDKVDGLLTKVTAAVDDTGQALQDVKKIAANTRDVSATARSVLVNNRGKIDAMIASLKITGDNLKNATAEVRRSPWRLLYKPSADEMANLNLYDSARQFAEGAGQMNDAATALRDALKDPNIDQARVQTLIEKLDKSFENFNGVEKDLWNQVKP